MAQRCSYEASQYGAPPAHIIAAGADSKGKLIEMIGVELNNGKALVYHAQKLTAKMQAELGL